MSECTHFYHAELITPHTSEKRGHYIAMEVEKPEEAQFLFTCQHCGYQYTGGF